MSYFDDEKNYVGVLTTRLAKETSLVQGATGIRVKATLEAIVGMSAGLAIAFIFGWQLALLLLAAFPLIGIAGGIQMKFAQGFSVKESNDSQQGGKVWGNFSIIAPPAYYKIYSLLHCNFASMECYCLLWS